MTRDVAVVALLVAATAQRAQPQGNGRSPYRVKKSDTLDVIAAEFYGDRNDAIFIVAENKMKQPRASSPASACASR